MLTNLEEYNNPLLYDDENEQYTEDVAFLLTEAAKESGIILDLACGTGRATIPLAKAGHSLIGVDIHPPMLQEAQKKAEALKLSVKWVEQDCTKLDLKIKSDFIYIVGNSFQHFLTNEEQHAFLSGVYTHLNDGGIFIVGIRFPSIEELTSTEAEEYWKSYQDSDTGYTTDVYIISHYDAIKQIQHNLTTRKIRDHETIIKEITSKIDLRYTFPQEMEHLLARIGFMITNVYGDWKKSALTNQSTQMIYVCKKQRVHPTP
ncbi:class I SAM-dependent methyltransferase [Priestia sp. TGN 0903]|uniref:class I SAM-dependent methyltransferase n=1 Tax=Priestia sp. TGN 0903 TaxID=3420730 RepID=UPI003D76C61C